jgi:hypothetical protein
MYIDPDFARELSREAQRAKVDPDYQDRNGPVIDFWVVVVSSTVWTLVAIGVTAALAAYAMGWV